MHYEIVADDLAAYLNDNRLWVEAYKHLGLFGDATRGFIPGKKAPKTSCPKHGGRSGEAFGLIHRGKLDSEATGVGVCNSCGVMSGFTIVMEETNWPFPKVLEQLAIASGYMDGITSGVFSPPPKSPTQLAWERERAEEDARRDQAVAKKNAQLWDEAWPLTKPQAEPAIRYLRNRQILSKVASLGGEVRLHPGVRYIDMNYGQCIITLEPHGMRYWWLDKNGHKTTQPDGVFQSTQKELIKEAVDLTHPSAKLARLAISQMPDHIKEAIASHKAVFHKGVAFKLDLGKHPCILCRIRDPSGKPVSLHQTFITSDGQKALVPKVKKLRPSVSTAPISGGAVQLCPPTPVLAVAEGLETLLSVESATGMQGWGLLNATLMGNWIVCMGVKHVYIWEDADAAGEVNAAKLEKNLLSAGIKVTRCNPKLFTPDSDMDWNDILVNFGPDVFPHRDWLQHV